MLRKLNFTERVKVPRSAVQVRLRREIDGALAFDPVLSLGDIKVPGDARVVLEAFHRTSFMRFDCGTVRALTIPENRRLSDIESSSIGFRLKIVDARTHRLFAVADGIRVTDREPDEGGRTPLLPVQFSDTLDQQLWRIAFEPDTPVLELNNRAQDIERMAKEDAVMFGAIYPAAVREILTRILLIDGHEVFEDGDEWWTLWIRWALRYSNDAPPNDPDDAARWIDRVVGAFCSRHRAVDRINAAKEAER